MKKHLSLLTILMWSIAVYANSDPAFNRVSSDTARAKADTLLQEEYPMIGDFGFLDRLDSLAVLPYLSLYALEYDTAAMTDYCFEANVIPVYSDSVYKERLASIDAQTPFNLGYNKYVKSFINIYLNKKRNLAGKVIGLSELYFPMIEAYLDQYDMPFEIKYLAVVESALNPSARSRAGAVGLWQFMYRTGKLYGLKVTSYEDERMNPEAATAAACQYLKYLHHLYDNWELALAAYNCGPGNVNKAIRRSGGKKDYWELWPYLPRETRGYVPAFIAVNYMFSYYKEHNIYPLKPVANFFEIDTVHCKKPVSFEQVSHVLGVSQTLLADLNPQYRRHYIPQYGEPQILTLPREMATQFILMEDSIYNFGKVKDSIKENEEPAVVSVPKENRTVHKVKFGEYLGGIAEKYGVGVSEVKAWNNLRGNRIYQGQQLIVYARKTPSKAKETSKTTTGQQKKPEAGGKSYTIKTGDTLWDIAKATGVSLDQLMQWNSELNFKRLMPGMQIIVGI